MAQSSSSAGELQLLQQFQRDINRMSDADRVTRKRGLQKLLDDLPWSSSKQMDSLASLLLGHILLPLITGISDPVEKCRELSILLLSSSLTTMRSDSLTFEMMMKIVRGLCERLNDIPCKETSEELRLQLLDLLKSIMKHQAFISTSSSNHAEAADLILTTMSKELFDTFPAAKRACAEIVCSVADISPISVRMSFKPLLKPLVANATHQHSKTRSATLQVETVNDKMKIYSIDMMSLPAYPLYFNRTPIILVNCSALFGLFAGQISRINTLIFKIGTFNQQDE